MDILQYYKKIHETYSLGHTSVLQEDTSEVLTWTYFSITRRYMRDTHMDIHQYYKNIHERYSLDILQYYRKIHEKYSHGHTSVLQEDT